MKKLRLDIHALQVESFEALVTGAMQTGTVRGNGDTSGCDVEIMTHGPTCEGESCVQTACATCLCPYSGPMPSCMPCSEYGCDTVDPAFC
ncbi:MAG TPA: hypothetical protein VE871_11075 [Longimicrobium sp.]|nr:hypothetical protein [Longimicrobium sp.]